MLSVAGIIALGFVFAILSNSTIDQTPKKRNYSTPTPYCPSCATKLGWKDMIPFFSYIHSRGKCPYCNAPLPLRNLIVDILELSWVAFYVLKFGWSYEGSIAMLYGMALIGIIFLTKERRELSDSLLMIMGMLAVIHFLAYNPDKFPEIQDYLITGDFLETRLTDIYTVPFAVIGNFPYNISSQIFFKILTCRDQVREVVCMIQKEVAVRISSAPGSRDYGILSVLLQAFYQVEYLFTVNPQVFNPPPKVTSSVIRMRRNNIENLDCNQSLFFKVVKTAFNQRRKMLRNSLKSLITEPGDQDPIWKCRPEQLGVQDFVRLTSIIEESGQTNT